MSATERQGPSSRSGASGCGARLGIQVANPRGLAMKDDCIFSSEVFVGKFFRWGVEENRSFLPYFPNGSFCESADSSSDSANDVEIIRKIKGVEVFTP